MPGVHRLQLPIHEIDAEIVAVIEFEAQLHRAILEGRTSRKAVKTKPRGKSVVKVADS